MVEIHEGLLLSGLAMWNIACDRALGSRGVVETRKGTCRVGLCIPYSSCTVESSTVERRGITMVPRLRGSFLSDYIAIYSCYT